MLIFMVAETRKEVLIVKTTIHDIMNRMIRVIWHPCIRKYIILTLNNYYMVSYVATEKFVCRNFQ
jgi:hypothetical protein